MQQPNEVPSLIPLLNVPPNFRRMHFTISRAFCVMSITTIATTYAHMRTRVRVHVKGPRVVYRIQPLRNIAPNKT
jgi:hypothetical protein